MKEELKKKYNIELVSLLRKTDKTYLIDSNNGKYILKYLSSNDENIYKRLSLLDCSSYYVLPLLSNNKKYIEYFNNKYYALFPYLEDEFISSKELRLSLYIKALAFLHKESKYPININDTYLNESISYLDECVDKVEFDIINKIEIIEKENYHSPYSWYFLNHYKDIKQYINLSNNKIQDLEENFKNEKDIELSLTYQNFDFNHINLKTSKVLSLEKMVLAPCIFDLYDLIVKMYEENISIKPYLNEYININPLKNYELNWLFALLFIPYIKYNNNQIDNIDSLMNSLKYLSYISSIHDYLYTNSPS